MFPLKDNIPTARFPVITVVLIALNLAVFVYQLVLPSDRASTSALAQVQVSERDQLSIEYGAIPYRITHPGDERCGVALTSSTQEIVCEGTPAPSRQAVQAFAELDLPPWWVTLITSMFLHAGLLHLVGNMLFLWVFGNNIEDSMGRPRFLLFYLLAGMAAVYGQALLDTASTVPTIGASGAVAGVLGAYALLHPRARVLTIIFIVFFFTFVEIPALVLLGLWFALQFLPAVGQLASPELSDGGGVAYFAHVAGFVFGLVMIKLFARRDRELPPAGAAYGARFGEDGLMNDQMRGVLLGMAVVFVLVFGGMTLVALGSAELNFASIIAFGFSFLIIVFVLLGLVGAIRNPPDEDE